MTIRGYSNAIVDVMLGWLKGLANWVLRLFNLAGSVSTSPLLWLSQNWLKLLIFFLVLGIVLDRLIWLIRWRPYWVWFRKERVIVNDNRFFANADMDKASDWEGDLANNWDEHDYVVASTVVRRQGNRSNSASKEKDRSAAGKAQQPSRRRRTGTKIQRHVNADEREPRGTSEKQHGQRRSTHQDSEKTEIFASQLKKRDVSDVYEDEVFNVSNLPVFDEFNDTGKRNAKSRKRKRR